MFGRGTDQGDILGPHVRSGRPASERRGEALRCENAKGVKGDSV